MAEIRIAIDTRELQKWAGTVVKKMPGALSNALRAAAREARSEFTKELAKDTNVPIALVKRGVSALVGPSPGKLVATWTASSAFIGIGNTLGGDGKRMYTRPKLRKALRGGSSLQFSTFKDTGGGSSHLQLRKAFIINVGGKQVVMLRTGKQRSSIRGVSAEMASTAANQPNSAPRLKWEKVVKTQLAPKISAAVQTVLDGGDVRIDTGSAD